MFYLDPVCAKMFCGAMSEFRLEERAVDFHASVMYLAEQKATLETCL